MEFLKAALFNPTNAVVFIGSWICFNNLNYLSPVVLSEFARLMGLVIGALREGKSTTHLAGEELQLHAKAACIGITTNLIKVMSK